MEKKKNKTAYYNNELNRKEYNSRIVIGCDTLEDEVKSQLLAELFDLYTLEEIQKLVEFRRKDNKNIPTITSNYGDL